MLKTIKLQGFYICYHFTFVDKDGCFANGTNENSQIPYFVTFHLTTTFDAT